MDRKVDVVKNIFFRQLAHRQHIGAARRLTLGKIVTDRAPDHVANRAFNGDFLPGLGRDQLAVTQHGHTVGNAKDFFHAMANKENRNPLRPQRCRQGKQLVNLMGRE